MSTAFLLVNSKAHFPIVTNSLNTSLHTHSQTLSLLSLQRATPNLPFQLIAPGRTLLKRGSLVQVQNNDSPKRREFLLFSDCLIWLAGEESSWWANQSSVLQSSEPATSRPTRPPMLRKRSKSDATPDAAMQNIRKRVSSPPPRRNASVGAGEEERWLFKGKAELVDLDIVVMPSREDGDEMKFEVLSPEGSFVLSAGKPCHTPTNDSSLIISDRFGRREGFMVLYHSTSEIPALGLAQRHASTFHPCILLL